MAPERDGFESVGGDAARLGDTERRRDAVRRDEFAAILGESPSGGARSPVLWNAAFAAQGVGARMIPIDVTAPRLDALLQTLDADPCFIGGAVTVPHKEAVAQWLGSRVAAEARAIGAVNCLYRGSDGHLHGTNTDGEGALRSFEAQFGPVRGKRVLLLGPGGAGKAVAAFFKHAGCDLSIAGRLREPDASRAHEAGVNRVHEAAIVASRLGARALAWGEIDAVLGECDVLINCTSVGAGQQVGASPVAAEQLGKLPPHAVVFDIIYQPSPSALLALAQARGLKTLDGSAMNLEQAVIAYGHAAPSPQGATATRAAMIEARKQFV